MKFNISSYCEFKLRGKGYENNYKQDAEILFHLLIKFIPSGTYDELIKLLFEYEDVEEVWDE